MKGRRKGEEEKSGTWPYSCLVTTICCPWTVVLICHCPHLALSPGQGLPGPPSGLLNLCLTWNAQVTGTKGPAMETVLHCVLWTKPSSWVQGLM
jgi:hypothetical protein